MSQAFGTGRLVLCLAVKAFAPRACRAEEDSGPETSQGSSEQAGSRSRLKSSGARKKIVTISSFPSLSSSVAALPQRPAQCSDRSPAWASPRAVMAPARAAASAVGQQVSRSFLCHNLAVVTLAVDSINAPRRRRRMRYFAFPCRRLTWHRDARDQGRRAISRHPNGWWKKRRTKSSTGYSSIWPQTLLCSFSRLCRDHLPAIPMAC